MKIMNVEQFIEAHTSDTARPDPEGSDAHPFLEAKSVDVPGKGRIPLTFSEAAPEEASEVRVDLAAIKQAGADPDRCAVFPVEEGFPVEPGTLAVFECEEDRLRYLGPLLAFMPGVAGAVRASYEQAAESAAAAAREEQEGAALERALRVALEPLETSEKTAEDYTAEGRADGQPDQGHINQARIEELLHMGLRPDGARRVERLEREGAGQDEIDRVKVAEGLRADPDARGRFIARVLLAVHGGQLTPYGALGRLIDAEVADPAAAFARYERQDRRCGRLLCYDEDGQPVTIFRVRGDLTPPAGYHTTSAHALQSVSPLPA